MAKIQLPFVLGEKYRHNTRDQLGEVSRYECILPTFEKDNFASYEKCDKYPKIPFRMVIVGSSGSGKSELMKKIYEKEPSFYVERDNIVWYGGKHKYPENAKGFPFQPRDTTKHTILIFDDPQPMYYPMISDVFRLGRPKGISPILAVHSWDQLISNQHLRYINDGLTNVYVFCQSAASNVMNKHARSFEPVLACSDRERCEKIIYSMDGTADYNWIICGKDAELIKLNYTPTMKEYTKKYIDPILYSSDDDTSDVSSSDDEYADQPISKKACLEYVSKCNKEDLKRIYEQCKTI